MSSGTTLEPEIFFLHSPASLKIWRKQTAVLRRFTAWNLRPAYSWLVSHEEKPQTLPNRGNRIHEHLEVIPGSGLPRAYFPTHLPLQEASLSNLIKVLSSFRHFLALLLYGLHCNRGEQNWHQWAVAIRTIPIEHKTKLSNNYWWMGK